MSMIRWDPFASAEDSLYRMLPSLMGRVPRFAADASMPEWRPSADISETDKEYLIRAELPAVKKEDVNVTIDSGVIRIQGQRKQDKEVKNEKVHRLESFYGSFERSLTLPDNVNPDAVRCESKDGVLTVHVPKTQEHKQSPKRIAVE